MRAGVLSLFLTLVVFLSSAVYGLGVGLRWDTEIINVKYGETKCIVYGIYNPFGTDSAVKLQTTGNITELVKIIEPPEALIPADTWPADSVDVKLCLYGMRGEFPYKPAVYSGEVLAAITGSKVGGSGSAVGASVAAPLEVRVGDLGLYNRIRKTAISLTLIIVGTISLVGYKKYKRKKWEITIRNECPVCKKTYPYDSKFCHDDGTELVKYKGDERLS